MHFVFNTSCALSKMSRVRATVAFWKIGDDEIGNEASGDTRVSVRQLVDGGSGGGSSADFVVACAMPSPLSSRLNPIGHMRRTPPGVSAAVFLSSGAYRVAADMVDATFSRRDKKGAVAMRGTLRPPIRERRSCCGAKRGRSLQVRMQRTGLVRKARNLPTWQ